MDWEKLWRLARREFVLGENSIHGPRHWQDVEANGVSLCAQSVADQTVVRCFAIFHDCKRVNENRDPHHGRRVALFLEENRHEIFGQALDDAQFALLCEAIATHADGTTTSNETVGTCFDADRLDLIRVGIVPSPSLMSTRAGKREATRF